MSETIVVSLIRDAGDDILFIYKRLISFGYPVFVLEGDSSDGTARALDELAEFNNDFIVFHYDTGKPKWPSVRSAERCHHLAMLRNKLIEEAVKFFNPSYILMHDSDIISEPTLLDKLFNIIKNNNNIGGVAPMIHIRNTKIFYDIWGYRDIFNNEFNPIYPYTTTFKNKPFMVNSVGGVLLFKRDFWDNGARYSGPDCDTVAFSHDIRKMGFNIIVDPSIISYH